MQQPVDSNNQVVTRASKVFSMIDNYIYLYHTKTLIAIPTFPESIADNMGTTYAETTMLSRSAPIYSFSHAGPRSFQVSLMLHRDMMNEVNTASSNLKLTNLSDVDYVDTLVKQLYGAALPKYASGEKMVSPPIVAVRFGDDIFCKGVIDGGVTVTYSGPIISRRTDEGTMPESKYAQIGIDFTIKEIDPYDATAVMTSGGYRGISKDLEGIVWKTV